MGVFNSQGVKPPRPEGRGLRGASRSTRQGFDVFDCHLLSMTASHKPSTDDDRQSRAVRGDIQKLSIGKYTEFAELDAHP
jgi:hypothetical protein